MSACEGFHMASHFANNGGKNSTPGYSARESYQSPYGYPAGPDGPSSRRGGSGKRRWPIVVGFVCAFLMAIVAMGGFAAFNMYNDVKQVRDDALSIIEQARVMKDGLVSGDAEALASASEDIQTRAARMHETTSGTLWNIAALVPVYGDDVSIVQRLSATLDDLAQEAIAPLADSAQNLSLSSLFGEDGTIDVATLSALADVLVSAKDPVNRAAEELSSLPEAHISQLEEALDKALPLVGTLNDGVNAAADIAPYLPQMLGANGQTRTYIVVAQSNAEIRATGGFPGSVGLMRITDGKISLEDFGGVSKISGDDQPVALNEKEQGMFAANVPSTPQLITTNPDFPVVGEHFRDLWAARIGDVADGVIALDPVFLQHMLALTGGAALSDGSVIDGTNAARILLHDVYFNKPTAEQDAYFAEAAGAATSTIMSNLDNADLSSLITIVTDDVKAGRFMAWMANADEQAAITKLGLDNGVSEDETAPELGVYVNDNTWAKKSWYLSIATQIGESALNTDGTRSYQVTTRLKNNLTNDEAATAPGYVTGYNPARRSAADLITEVYLYAPAGGSISDIQVSTGESFGQTSYGGIQVWRIAPQLQLDALQESVITYTVTVSASAQSDLTVRSTPTAQEVAGWQL